MNEGERRSNLYDSRTWTGLNLPTPDVRWRLSRYPRIRYFFWWAKVGLKRLICPHDWSFHRCSCDICGLTAEEMQDHSPRRWLASKSMAFVVRERV